MSQRRRVCAVCGSTRFRLLSAQLVCHAGHVQRDFRVEAAQEDDGFDTQITTRSRNFNRSSQRDARRIERQQWAVEQRRKRRGRVGHVFPGTAEHASLSDPDKALLQGTRATFAIVQCLQLILRHQIESVSLWLPGVDVTILETCARKIWAYNVSCHNVPAAPLEAARDTLSRQQQSKATPLRSVPRRGRQRYETPNSKSVRTVNLSIRSTVAVLYLAFVQCRIPITLGDLRKRIFDRTLPYLNAIRFLPNTLTSALSFSDIQFANLDCNHIPSVTELHRRTEHIASQLYSRFDVMFLEVNSAPILSRYVHDLLLPSTFYVGAKSLLTFLRIDMHVHSVSVMPVNPIARAKFKEKRPDAGTRNSKHAFSRNSVIPRSVMLMAALLVVVKLQYGLDGIRRRESPLYVHDRAIFSGAAPQDAWIDAICALHGLPSERTWDAVPAEFAPWDTQIDLLSLSDKDVDTYLSFLEDHYAPKNIPSSMPLRERNDEDDLLPCLPGKHRPEMHLATLSTQNRKTYYERRAQLQSALYTQPNEEDTICLAPGEGYATHTHDPGGVMPREMKRVLDVAMKVIGLDTTPEPAFETTSIAWGRPHDQTVLADCMMQLEEGLLVMLRQRR